MTRLTRSLVLCIVILIPTTVIGQNGYAEKTVNLPTGRTTLKNILKSLSEQTGCIFSYDPTEIIDKQKLDIPKCSKLPLVKALHKVLPKQIQFKLNGKYVVLQKAIGSSTSTKELKKSQPQQLQAANQEQKIDIKISKNDPKDSLTSLNSKTDVQPENSKTFKSPDLMQIDSVPENTFNQEPALTKKNIESETQNPAISSTSAASLDSIKTTPIKLDNKTSRWLFEIELAGNNHLATVSSHIGLKSIYSIISIGADYNKSYHLGLGLGTNLNFGKHIGLDLDLTQYAIAGGRSKKIKIKAATTQLSADLNYSIGQRLKIFAGPSVYIIKSSYVNRTTTVLGNFFGYSALVGIRINLAKKPGEILKIQN